MANLKTLNIVNKKAKYEYEFIRTLEAGISLVGTEVKSIKAGNVNLSDAYCLFKNDELYLKSMYVAEYELGNQHNHEARRDRKLLLRKPELKKLQKHVKERGYSIIPYRVYLSERGFIKIEIVIGTGKKSYDKRNTIRDRESKRDLDRINKNLS